MGITNGKDEFMREKKGLFGRVIQPARTEAEYEEHLTEFWQQEECNRLLMERAKNTGIAKAHVEPAQPARPERPKSSRRGP